MTCSLPRGADGTLPSDPTDEPDDVIEEALVTNKESSGTAVSQLEKDDNGDNGHNEDNGDNRDSHDENEEDAPE